MSPQKFLNDLYAEMRDRRLLPVAAVLLVALVAVPFLLGGGDDAGTVPAGAAGSADLRDGAAGARQLEPVVLAEAPELREYEKRLAKLQSRNPFKQQATSAPPGSEEASDGGGGSATGGAGSASDSSAAAPSDSSGSSSTPAGGGGGGQIERFTITYEINVKAGQVGKAKQQKGVELLDYLPDRKHPVLQFVGVTPNLSRAVFVVSGNAESVGGDGKCVPNKNSCEFIAMSVGEEHRFLYEPNQRTYKIKLNKITEVKVKDKGSSSQGSSAFERLAGK
jgi:hypothetical protein